MTLVVSGSLIIAKEHFFHLNGHVFYIDAGHGGKDNGASYNELLEDEINLAISKLLIEKLIDKGAYVYSSRDNDYDLADNYNKNRKNKDLKRRVELINKINPDVFISIHLNTYPDNNVKGGQAFYQKNDNSHSLANCVQKRLNQLSLKQKKAKLGDYYLLNKTTPVGILIECGFLTNQEDSKMLSSSSYQNKLVDNIIVGIKEYFDLIMV